MTLRHVSWQFLFLPRDLYLFPAALDPVLRGQFLGQLLGKLDFHKFSPYPFITTPSNIIHEAVDRGCNKFSRNLRATCRPRRISCPPPSKIGCSLFRRNVPARGSSYLRRSYWRRRNLIKRIGKLPPRTAAERRPPGRHRDPCNGSILCQHPRTNTSVFNPSKLAHSDQEKRGVGRRGVYTTVLGN